MYVIINIIILLTIYINLDSSTDQQQKNQADIDELKSHQVTYLAEIDTLKTSLSQHEASLTDSEKKHEEEKIKLKALIEQNLTKAHKTDLHTLHKQVEELEKARESLSKEIDMKKSEEAGFKNEIQTLTQEFDTLKSVNVDLEERLKQTQSNLSESHKNEINSLQKQIENHTSTIENLNLELSSHKSEIEKLSRDLDVTTSTKTSQIGELKNAHESLSDENLRLEAKLNDLVNQAEETRLKHESDMTELKNATSSQLKQIKSDNKTLRKENETFKSEYQTLSGR